VWWFSPHLNSRAYFGSITLIIRVGEITQGRRIVFNSRSPLSEPVLLGVPDMLLHVGEIHRVENVFLLSFSPLFFFFCLFFSSFIQMTGRFTWGSLFNTLVLPTMNRKITILMDPIFDHILTTFFRPPILLCLSAVVW